MTRTGLLFATLLLLGLPQSAEARGTYAYMCYQYHYDLVGKRVKYCAKPTWAKARMMSGVRTEVRHACKGTYGPKTRASVKFRSTPIQRLQEIHKQECHQKITLAQARKRKGVSGSFPVTCGGKSITVYVTEYRDKKGRVRVRRWRTSTGKIVTEPYPKYLQKGKKAEPRKEKLLRLRAILCGGMKSARTIDKVRQILRSFAKWRLRGLQKECKAYPTKRKCRELKTKVGGHGNRG